MLGTTEKALTDITELEEFLPVGRAVAEEEGGQVVQPSVPPETGVEAEGQVEQLQLVVPTEEAVGVQAEDTAVEAGAGAEMQVVQAVGQELEEPEVTRVREPEGVEGVLVGVAEGTEEAPVRQDQLRQIRKV
jgi:hypothetical protein